MTHHRYKGLFVIALIGVLVYAFLFSATTAFADEPAPAADSEETTALSSDESQSEPTVETEADESQQAEADDVETATPVDPQDEPVDPADELVVEQPLLADEAGTSPEQEPADEAPVGQVPVALEQLPTDTTVVVLIDEQVEPLATQAAAEALELGDPMWCPAGSKPGDPGCGPSYTSLASLLADLRAQNGGTGVDQDGTIWIEDIYASSSNDPGVASFNLNGTTLTTWAQHALTFQGGWNGNTDSTGTISGVSDFSARILILNWNNTVSINDISIDLGHPATTLDGLTVTTTGDIHLDNVTGKNSSRNGASLNNTSGNGHITVTDSDFNGNSNNGLVANSNGAITLHNVTANTNGSNGASLNDSNGTGAIVLTGTNVFNGNTLSGLRAVSSSDITSSDSLTANDNGSYGALLNNVNGTGHVALSGTNSFNNNTLDGLRVISTGNITSTGSLTAGSNSQYGVFLNNSSGTGSISLAGTIVLNNSALEGLRALSSGNITSAADLTANNNSRYGVFLNNSTGTGNITFSGTNTFSGNNRSGLHLLSNGAVSLANLTAKDNGTGGNPRFGYGVYVDNRTGAAGVTLSGSNNFSGNYSTGLVILTNGAIVANNLVASDNGQTGNSNPDYGYGAYLDNSTGAASVKLSGASVFNSNYASGLLVNSLKDVTLNSITAGASFTTGNGAHGILVISGSTVSLTGVNNMIGNLFDGLHVTAVGDINIYNPNANANGQNGVYIETTAGNSSLRCGQLDDNGQYGVNAVQNRALYLFSMEFNGNALGSIHTDGGAVYTYSGGCGADLSKHSLGDQRLPLNTVFVSGAQQPVALDCRLYAGTRLILPNGDSALVPCPSGEFASLQGLSKASLPGGLPGSWKYGSGFALELGDTLGGQVSLSFVIPDGMSADTLAILFWDGNEWVEVAGASQKGDRFEAQGDHPGIFVLVGK